VNDKEKKYLFFLKDGKNFALLFEKMNGFAEFFISP